MLSLLLLALTALVVAAYRRDLGNAQKRARAGSTMLEVQSTSIEFATLGQGAPVLVLHGTGGGWDQGLDLARGLVSYGFRLIAPSRFGYLRTPLPPDPSPQAEADTWARFLDSLGIEKIPVIAASAGAAPAVQFALRHPDRVSALILLVPGAGGLAFLPAIGPSAFMMKVVLRLNFPFWLAMHVARNSLYRMVAVPPSLVPSLSTSDRAQLNEAVARILPVTSRRQGILNDAKTQESARQYDLARVSAPTLLFSAEDDLYNTRVNARIAAHLIPHATLVEFKSGGHLLLGHAREVWPLVAKLIRNVEASSHAASEDMSRDGRAEPVEMVAHGGTLLGV